MSSYNKILNDLAPKKFNKIGIVWIIVLCAVIVLGLLAYIDQIINGMQVTNLRDYALWGVYISNFVFFVATSFVGALIASIMRLTKIKWRTPLVRIAEIIAVASIAMAGLTIILDMGRPDRIHYLFIYPRLQSVITWDVLIISIYLTFSIMLLYIPNIPDFALLKKHYKNNPFLKKLYGFLAINWNGSERQKIVHQKSMRLITITMIPLALILQSIDAWLFSSTYRIGWDSTNFGPYFISGAFVAGTSALIVAVYVIHKYYKAQEYITELHFDKLGKLMVLACLIYLYFNIIEYLIPAYKSTEGEVDHIMEMFFGHFSSMFWFVIVGGLVLPSFLLLFKSMRKPLPIFMIALLIVVTSWWKRYVIVTPTLLSPFLPIQGVPEGWHHYFPSLHEWLTTSATLAMALLIITFLIRFIPVIPIQVTLDEQGVSETKIDKKKPIIKTRKKAKILTAIIIFLGLIGNVFFTNAQEVKKDLSISLSYLKIVNDTSFINISTSYKDDNGWHEAINIPFEIFKINDDEIYLGKGITNENGKTLFKLSKTSVQLENTIKLKVTNQPLFEDVEEMLTFKEVNLSAQLIINDNEKQIAASLLDMEGNPIPDEGLQVQVKRMFNGLNIGDGTYFTDENGEIAVNIDENYNSFSGNLVFEVTLEEHDEYGTVKVEMNSDLGIKSIDLSTFNKRTLWSPSNKTPLFLLIFSNLMLLIILGIFIRLLLNLIQLSKY
ncbi:NrfD/PsrC family molybdoenzyme membrane anchor subunit [Lutibacter sp.]|uniref:NrfD/PsrC family molybdoenzyme membrane anchor subunit n=1 Tax=Lutibacter sp. TaxID=1925666 RepID=UPI00356A6D4C